MRKLKTTKYTGGDTTVYLTESQWRDMLNRFKIENIHRKGSSGFEIKVGCGLCKTFYELCGEVYCRNCPLKEAGCIHLLGKHGSEELCISASNSQIDWDEDDNREVRKGIRELRKVLLGMPRTRRVK